MYLTSSETQGHSVGLAEKAGRKISSTGERAPGYRLSPNYFQKIQAKAGSWLGTKNALYYCAQSANSLSWVLSHHTCQVRSPSLCVQGKLLFSTFLTRNEATTDESKKRLECYKQEQFNLLREYSVFDGSQCIVNNRKFEMWQRRESQISNTLTRQNNFVRASRLFVHFFAVNCTTTRENAQFHLIQIFETLPTQWRKSLTSCGPKSG